MRCRRAQRLALLKTSGDTTAGEERRLGTHLRRCPSCATLASAALPPLTGIRAKLPFGEEDLAAMRAGVLRRIERERPQRRPGAIVLRSALAAAALILIVLIAVVPQMVRHESAAHIAPPVSKAALHPPQPSNPAPIAAIAARSRTLKTAVARSRPQSSRRRREQGELPIAPVVSPSAMRIELHTSDPNVRILWIVHGGDTGDNSPIRTTSQGDA